MQIEKVYFTTRFGFVLVRLILRRQKRTSSQQEQLTLAKALVSLYRRNGTVRTVTLVLRCLMKLMLIYFFGKIIVLLTKSYY